MKPDACAPRARALQREEPLQGEARALQPEKRLLSDEDPAQPKINK